jgi:hypothetical protein
MANYTLVPVDGNKIKDHFGDALFEKLVPYQPHLFDDIEWDATDSDVPFSGRVQLSDTSQVYVVKPTDHGFVVKKQYRKDPDESDKVLQEWGDYREFMVGQENDTDFQLWLQTQIVPLFSGVDHLDKIKVMCRIRAFNARRSDKYKGKIKVFQSHKDRDDNREVAMKPGRAISLMFPELDHKTLIGITDGFLQRFAPRKLTVHESTEPAKFYLAYAGEQSENENVNTTWSRKHMAHSCMRYDFDHLQVHPAEVYASGDFKIIYVLDQNDLVAGRCVVATHLDAPQAGPIYGVSEQAISMIENHLSSEGAVMAGSATWDGARLTRIVHDEDSFVAPYLDLSPQALHDDGEHLVVCEDGEIDATCYSGVLGGHYTNCSCCNVGLNEDAYYYSESTDEHYCEDCYYDTHSYCEYAGEHVHDSAMMTVYFLRNGQPDTERVAEWETDGDTFCYSEVDGEWWHADCCVWSEYESDWIPETLLSDYFESDFDNEWYPLDQMAMTEDGHDISIDEAKNDGYVKNPDNDVWELKGERKDA